MADGHEKSPKGRGQRPPAPHIDGPLGSSGAAPEEADPATDTSAVDEHAEVDTRTGWASGAATPTGATEQISGATTPAGTSEQASDVAAPAGTSDKSDSTAPRVPTGTASGAVSAATSAVGKATPAVESAPGTGADPEATIEAKAGPGDATGPKPQPESESEPEPRVEARPDATPAGTKTPATAPPDAKNPDAKNPDATNPDATNLGLADPEKTTTAAAATPSGSEAANKTKTAGEAITTPKADSKAKDATKSGEGDKGNNEDNSGGKPKSGDKADPSDTTKTGKEGKPEEKEKAGSESKTGDKPEGKPGDKPAPEAPSAAAVAAASKGRATRALRRANPVRVARSTARSTSAWAKRPSGRLILPAVIAILLLGAAGTAGALLVPQALHSVPSPSATPGFGVDTNASAGSASAGPLPSLGGFPSASAPVIGGTALPTVPPVGGAVGGARPADALATWAQETGTRAGIPVVAVQAYGYAELVVARTNPTCHLNWTTIAALAKVESQHGSANGAVLNVDGSVVPPIRGLPLDGKGGRLAIRDTDQGALDGDVQFDRALGPLQFLPQTWTAISVGNGVDADSNGISDPNDIDDASLAAAKYLCQGGRDLAKPDAWWEAILSYNAVRPYAQKVFDAAHDYGQRSRV